ncbi:hypothetical protein BFR43_01030 [Brochothrix thermosphacta]|nr:hypothetical protein BFR43_01030 [Brochothrix thermosphacta]
MEINDNVKFWFATIVTIILYYIAFSILTTGIFHTFFILSGSFTLLLVLYYLTKQKIKGLVNFIRYFIDKGRS